MTNVVLTGPRHADDQKRHDQLIWWTVFTVMTFGGLLIAGFARRRFGEPFLGLSLGILLVMVLSWTYRPRATLYVTIFLTVVSDIVTVGWFPFAKNLSSRESISFVSDSLTISPLDISLTVGLVLTAASQYARTGRLVPPSPLTRPLVVFTGFVVIGFFRGLLLGGRGDTRVAVLEARPLFYILMTYVIAVNVCTHRKHLRYAFWWAISGVIVQVMLSIEYVNRLEPAAREALDSLNEHGSTLGHNLVIVTAFGLITLGVKALVPRLLMLVALVPTMYVVFISQRRSGIAALAIAFVILLAVLFWRRKSQFWVLTPILLIVGVGYLGAFWNSTASAGFPAQAIKSIVAPGSATEEDRSSDLYRVIEGYDINFTIRSNPLLGVGFGKPFYRPVPLPDISFFELNAFLPHNAILWIWLKTGIGGFAAMFYFFTRVVVLGARRVRELPRTIDLVVAQSALLFVIMYVMFSYVDISWDARNTVLLALAARICSEPAIAAPSGHDEAKPADEPQVVSTPTSSTIEATASA